MAAQALSFNGSMAPAITGQYVPIVNGRRMAAGIPEVYIAKQIDNSRLVKVTDHKRQREIYMFSAGLTAGCPLIMPCVLEPFRSSPKAYRIQGPEAHAPRVQGSNRALARGRASPSA